jgi:hypothetical protein
LELFDIIVNIPIARSLMHAAQSQIFEQFQKHEIKNVEDSLLLLHSALQPLVGFRPAQLSLSIFSRKVLLSAVSSGTSNPQLRGEPGI